MTEVNLLPTPCYIIDEKQLRRNLEILQKVQEDTGCRILLAQKAFSIPAVYPMIGRYLAGTTSSSLYEARLGHGEMKGETHIFSPAYKENEFDEISTICSHIVFNSFAQLEKFRSRCDIASIGIRINPECSTQEHAIYDPCAPGSRLGVTADKFRPDLLDGVDGFHFHTLCEQGAEDLERTLRAVEQKFGTYLYRIKWLNMGGGQNITHPGYDLGLLENCIRQVQDTYGVRVYLEPGEAVAYNAGYLVTEVLDIVESGGVTTLILDTSAACHMPDVLEMPYRPPLKDSGLPWEKKYTYRLSSVTCLAGDIIGDYSFDMPVTIGDRLYFEDMAIYTMVKNNTFNGIPLPTIAIMKENGHCRIVRSFGYRDFKSRLS